MSGLLAPTATGISMDRALRKHLNKDEIKLAELYQKQVEGYLDRLKQARAELRRITQRAMRRKERADAGSHGKDTAHTERGQRRAQHGSRRIER